MAYTKQTWVLGLAGGTPLNATRLNHMEQGIADAHTLIADLALANHTHTSAQITDATATNTVNTIVKRDATGFIAVSGITGLSTATGSTQAVPKSQLDAAIAGVSGTNHTHTASQISDSTTTGRSLLTAADALAGRTVLGVDSSTEVNTKDATTLSSAQSDATTKANNAETNAKAHADTRVDFAPIHLAHNGTSYPTRPNTSGTNRKVYWFGPASAALPTNGTATGGTAAAAPGDVIFEH